MRERAGAHRRRSRARCRTRSRGGDRSGRRPSRTAASPTACGTHEHRREQAELASSTPNRARSVGIDARTARCAPRTRPGSSARGRTRICDPRRGAPRASIAAPSVAGCCACRDDRVSYAVARLALSAARTPDHGVSAARGRRPRDAARRHPCSATLGLGDDACRRRAARAQVDARRGVSIVTSTCAAPGRRRDREAVDVAGLHAACTTRAIGGIGIGLSACRWARSRRRARRRARSTLQRVRGLGVRAIALDRQVVKRRRALRHDRHEAAHDERRAARRLAGRERLADAVGDLERERDALDRATARRRARSSRDSVSTESFQTSASPVQPMKPVAVSPTIRSFAVPRSSSGSRSALVATAARAAR